MKKLLGMIGKGFGLSCLGFVAWALVSAINSTAGMLLFIIWSIFVGVSLYLAIKNKDEEKKSLFVGFAILPSLQVLTIVCSFAVANNQTNQTKLAAQTANGYTGGVYTGMQKTPAPLPTKNAAVRREEAKQQAQQVANSQHEERAQYHDYWEKVTGELGLSEAAVLFAMDSATTGDSVSAIQLLNKANEIAQRAGEDAESAPDKYNNHDISQKLVASAEEIKEATEDMKSYFDNGEPSKMAEAEDKIGKAREWDDEATHNARIIYADLGGNTSDLDSVEDQIKASVDLVHTLTDS